MQGQQVPCGLQQVSCVLLLCCSQPLPRAAPPQANVASCCAHRTVQVQHGQSCRHSAACLTRGACCASDLYQMRWSAQAISRSRTYCVCRGCTRASAPHDEWCCCRTLIGATSGSRQHSPAGRLRQQTALLQRSRSCRWQRTARVRATDLIFDRHMRNLVAAHQMTDVPCHVVHRAVDACLRLLLCTFNGLGGR